MDIRKINPEQAQNIIASLRTGVPPKNYVRYFTVGRENELKQLTDRLSQQEKESLLLQANWGSGKSHLLLYIREQALADSYAVSMVQLDAMSKVRFNRMDQMFGAICRNIEVPGAERPGAVHTAKGIQPFFALVNKQMIQNSENAFWMKLSNQGKWNFSQVLDSPAMFVALRAWIDGSTTGRNLVEDWFFNPQDYRSQRRKLYSELVTKIRFSDPRQEWKFYNDEIFWFHTQAYAQSWAAIRDLDLLAKESGLKGLIILFDEFEDVINNITNIQHQEAAFWNLFEFFSGKQFPDMTFYAVTPDFVDKCKGLLETRGRWDFDYTRFDALPTFQMSPLDISHLTDLAQRIVPIHGIAYGWDAKSAMTIELINKVVRDATKVQIQDRTRQTIKAIVKCLDDLFEKSNE